MIEIQEQALFIADSHYPHHGEAFVQLLRKIDSGEIVTPQLFLMGDNFDLLFGYNTYIQIFSSNAIALLQKLSRKLDIYYFEGNHDFCLAPIFENIQIIPRHKQPVFATLGKKMVGLSHGDRYGTGMIYDLYSKLLRQKIILLLLRPFGKWIIDHRMKALSQKKICHTFPNFEAHVQKILRHYQEVDLVIEGHFHQAKKIGNYISLPSQACQGSVGVVKDGEVQFVHL